MASERSPSNYRRYSPDDLKRLERIRVYRQAGLALKDIQSLLSANSGAGRGVLERRLGELGEEMTRLRVQQELLLRLLGRTGGGERPPLRQVFVGVLRQLGLSEPELDRLHAEFERLAPDDHHRFLRFIGLSEAEARRLRALSLGGRPRA